jgi:DNA-binding HxlR family transcriptional regulator
VLTDHLRELEHDDIIFHQRDQQGGVQISRYGFSAYGSTLIPVLDLLGAWGLEHEARAQE